MKNQKSAPRIDVPFTTLATKHLLVNTIELLAVGFAIWIHVSYFCSTTLTCNAPDGLSNKTITSLAAAAFESTNI